MLGFNLRCAVDLFLFTFHGHPPCTLLEVYLHLKTFFSLLLKDLSVRSHFLNVQRCLYQYKQYKQPEMTLFSRLFIRSYAV